MLSLQVENPAYQINVFGYNIDNSGNKVASDPLPTYSSCGLDGTPWTYAIMQFERYAGTTSVPSLQYIFYVLKINITLYGIGGIRTAAVDLLPETTCTSDNYVIVPDRPIQ